MARTLIEEFTREVREAETDFTIDGLVILDDDTAYALAYDAAESVYRLLEGKRGEEGICFEPVGPQFEDNSDALDVLARLSEGFPIVSAVRAAA